MSNEQEKISPHLYEYIKKKVDLSEYLSTELGCLLRWFEPKIYAGLYCPLPTHKDNKPSFRIKYMEDRGIWTFNCFGCNAHGTIIDFCREYYGFNSNEEVVMFLCEKFGFKKDSSVTLDGIKDVKKRINLQKKIACVHVVTAQQCLSLLKKDYNQYNIWVSNAYKKMNKALDEEDIETIEAIGYEATNKIQER